MRLPFKSMIWPNRAFRGVSESRPSNLKGFLWKTSRPISWAVRPLTRSKATAPVPEGEESAAMVSLKMRSDIAGKKQWHPPRAVNGTRCRQGWVVERRFFPTNLAVSSRHPDPSTESSSGDRLEHPVPTRHLSDRRPDYFETTRPSLGQAAGYTGYIKLGFRNYIFTFHTIFC